MTTTLTIDVKYKFTFTPEQCTLYSKRPNSSVYDVITDKMQAADKDAVFPKDDLTAVPVFVAEIKNGKLYIVEDCKGNIYLGSAKSKRRGDTLKLAVLNPNYEPPLIPIKDIKRVSLVYSRGRQVMSDERLAELCKYEAEYESMFTADQMEMIDLFLKETYGNQQPAGPNEFDDLLKNSTGNGKGIPVLKSKQLFPKDMVAEAQDPATTKERRAQIMMAFSKGYQIMQKHGFPAYRILFVEYEHLRNEIIIWVD